MLCVPHVYYMTAGIPRAPEKQGPHKSSRKLPLVGVANPLLLSSQLCKDTSEAAPTPTVSSSPLSQHHLQKAGDTLGQSLAAPGGGGAAPRAAAVDSPEGRLRGVGVGGEASPALHPDSTPSPSPGAALLLGALSRAPCTHVLLNLYLRKRKKKSFGTRSLFSHHHICLLPFRVKFLKIIIDVHSHHLLFSRFLLNPLPLGFAPTILLLPRVTNGAYQLLLSPDPPTCQQHLARCKLPPSRNTSFHAPQPVCL